MSTEDRPAAERVDADQVFKLLDEFWSDPRPDRITGSMPRRIAGGDWDAAIPEGTENPYWKIVRNLPLDPIGNGWRTRPEPTEHWFTKNDGGLLMFGSPWKGLQRAFSWSIPSPADIAWMRERLDGRSVVEVGAGGGYWAWLLSQTGTEVAAYDTKPAPSHWAAQQWHPVKRGSAAAAGRHANRALFLCWPSYGSAWAERVLRAYRGDQVIYAGEAEGGCCADDGFFRLLKRGWHEASEAPRHVSFWGLHCYLTEYRRDSTVAVKKPAL